MSLRLRLAIALAMLAAVSVIAVATTNYLQTSDRLHKELDAQIQADARPLLPESDPTGFLAAQMCFALATNADAPFTGYAIRVSAQLGNSLQCIDANGKVTGRTGEVNLPVTEADIQRDISSSVLATRTFRDHRYRTVTIPADDNGKIRIIRNLAPTENVLA